MKERLIHLHGYCITRLLSTIETKFKTVTHWINTNHCLQNTRSAKQSSSTKKKLCRRSL